MSHVGASNLLERLRDILHLRGQRAHFRGTPEEAFGHVLRGDALPLLDDPSPTGSGPKLASMNPRLSLEDRERLGRVVEDLGEFMAAARLGVSHQTLPRLLAGLPVRSTTLIAVEHLLGPLERELRLAQVTTSTSGGHDDQ